MMIKQFILCFLLVVSLYIILNISYFKYINAENIKIIHIPVRWCAIEGTPVTNTPHVPNPYGSIDDTTEKVLDTRLRMINDYIYNNIGISFYSLHHNLTKPYDTIPIIEDPNLAIGNPGNRSISDNEGGKMLERCNIAWKDKLQNKLYGLEAINIGRTIDNNGNLIDDLGGGCCVNVTQSYVIVWDNQYTSSRTNGGLGWNIDKFDKILGHEMAHALGLEYHSSDPESLMYHNIKKPDGKVSGIKLSETEISKMRHNALLIPGTKIQ